MVRACAYPSTTPQPGDDVTSLHQSEKRVKRFMATKLFLFKTTQMIGWWSDKCYSLAPAAVQLGESFSAPQKNRPRAEGKPKLGNLRPKAAAEA
jgi:hypothetical protein